MKHIYIVLSLAVLLFATSCIGKSGKPKAETPNQGKNTEQPKSEIVADLTQEYFTLEGEQPAINAEIKNGELWLTFHKDKILPVGIADENSYRLPDKPVKVDGLKGAPKNFIIADIGQDYNPILCVLTEEGKVQMLSLWNSVETGDMEAIEIPMDPIVGFKDGPGGACVDEDGTTFYDYTTIYGIDARGGEHEIPLYNFDNNLDYVEKTPKGEVDYKLYLSDAWGMRYIVGYAFSEPVEAMKGRFWLISENWDEMIFRFGYELDTRVEFTGEGAINAPISQKGVFDMQCQDFDTRIHVITPIEGVDFANKGMNVPVPFKPGSAIGG